MVEHVESKPLKRIEDLPLGEYDYINYCRVEWGIDGETRVRLELDDSFVVLPSNFHGREHMYPMNAYSAQGDVEKYYGVMQVDGEMKLIIFEW